MKPKQLILAVLLFLPLLASAQGRGFNDRITNDLSRLPAMDAVVDSFMNVWSLRGVSLSIMRGDSLVYARGYGRADGGRPMTPGTLLRMASVSKLLTAVGIMKLQERGKLVLDTPVFGPFGVLDEYDDCITDDNYYLITVEHLLRHQAGFTQSGGDPMFSTPVMMREMRLSKAPTAEQLTRHLLRRPLAYLPGTTQEYSNFGYLLLSMIIEKITGEPYEDWMQREVLGPAGCTDFHIGGNFYENRFPGETRYYMHKEAKPSSSFDGRGQVERCYGGKGVSLQRLPDDRPPVRRNLFPGLGGLHHGRRMDPDRLVLGDLGPRQGLSRRRMLDPHHQHFHLEGLPLLPRHGRPLQEPPGAFFGPAAASGPLPRMTRRAISILFWFETDRMAAG